MPGDNSTDNRVIFEKFLRAVHLDSPEKLKKYKLRSTDHCILIRISQEFARILYDLHTTWQDLEGEFIIGTPMEIPFACSEYGVDVIDAIDNEGLEFAWLIVTPGYISVRHDENGYCWDMDIEELREVAYGKDEKQKELREGL